MRVLQVVNSFPPTWGKGGPARVSYEISKELVKRGHEVTVYTTDINDESNRLKNYKNPSYIDGIAVYRFKNLNNALAWRNVPVSPGMLFALSKNIRNFDIIHAHLYRSFQAILVHYYAKKYNIPYVLQVHGSVPQIIGRKQMKKIYDKLLGNSILFDAKKIIALTQSEVEQFRALGIHDEKIEIVPNGIDLIEYGKLPQKGYFRKRYSIPENYKVILYLGRIHKIKGLDLLVKAFSLVSSEMKDIKLVIVGPDDGYLKELNKLINFIGNDNIILAGPLYGKEKMEAYVDSDLYVLPSSYEAFPNTVFEAGICGTPVIVTDRCGISQIVNDKIGYVSKFNENDLKNTMIRILRDNSSKIKIKHEMEKIIGIYNWPYIVKLYETLYEDLIS